MTISAVIPAYNRADTLKRALCSVFAQSRVPDEVIVVDDGSTDGTARVAGKFPEVRLVRLERNGGAANARNEGVRAARGDHIAFLDSDDEWHPRKLEVQLAQLGAASADLVCTGVIVRNQDGVTEQHGFDAISPDVGWSFREFQNYPFSPSTWLARRSMFDTAGLFDARMRNCEDLEFLARISGRHRIRVLGEPLVTKHNRSDSLDANLERTARSFEVLFARYPQLWARSPRSVITTLVRLASMQMTAGDDRSARTSLWRAARRHPAFPQPWLLLAASLLGPRLFTRIAHRVVRARLVTGARA